MDAEVLLRKSHLSWELSKPEGQGAEDKGRIFQMRLGKETSTWQKTGILLLSVGILVHVALQILLEQLHFKLCSRNPRCPWGCMIASQGLALGS